MYLQSYKTFPLPDHFVFQVYHFVTIQPCGDLIIYHPYFKFIPFAHFQIFLIFRFRFDQPAATIRFLNPTSMMTSRRHFHLPAADLYTFNGRTNKHSAVPVGLLPESKGKFKIFVGLVGRQISVTLIGSAFTNQFSFFYIPLFCSMYSPASKILSIKYFFLGR